MTNDSRSQTLVSIHSQIRELFHNAHKVLIVSHIRPDGDAVGSVLALGLALSNAGKDVRMALADGVPANFRHLAGSERIHRSAGNLAEYDLLVAVDSSDLRRLGGLLEDRTPSLNIDHHVTNPGFAGTNLILPEQVATSAIIAEYLEDWGLAFDPAIAAALLTGIVTDTIGFRTENVNPDALRLSAMLMEKGANLPELYMRGLVSKTYEAARYWGCGLNRLQREVIEPGGTLVWTSLTLADRVASGYKGNDDADLVNILSTIEGDLALIFVEQKNEHVKISWRARSGFDVSQIALQFGGGGHPAAAGADVPGTLETVQGQILEATRAMLARRMQNLNGKKPE